MKYSSITVDVKGFTFREIHPLKNSEIEDAARAKGGSRESSIYKYHCCRNKFIESCLSFPESLIHSDEFGGNFECNDENKGILYDTHDYFVNVGLLGPAMREIIYKRAEQLKNCVPGLLSGKAGQEEIA